MRQGYLLSSFSINIILEILARREEYEEIKSIKTRKEDMKLYLSTENTKIHACRKF
jgi:hypothetical protein